MSHPLRSRPLRRLVVVPLLLALAGCGGAPPEGGSSPATREGAGEEARPPLTAVVASYDVAVGPPSRFLVGAFVQGEGLLGRGAVDLAFSFLGEQKAGPPQPGPRTSATYLPVYGSETGEGDVPALLPPAGRGVYAAQVAFDRPGLWEVELSTTLEGTPQRATAAFSVLPAHRVPAPGDPALPSEHPVMGSGVPPVQIDSAAVGGGPVPDPRLHEATIAAALRERRPVLAVFSTPTFCQSQFCGPVTDLVDELARDHAARAAFVHVEIWQDYQNQKATPAALEWLARDGGELNEPWVFLIGADGRVVARWDNVVTRPEIEPLLVALPAGGS